MSVDDFNEWLQHGIEHGWVSDVVCETHEGVATTDEEAGELDEGYDPCIPVIRVWPDKIL